jgi:hypothetical protein
MLGNDAPRCSNGLTARTVREATPEEQVVCRRWLRGAIVLYGVLFVTSAVLAVVNYSGAGSMQISKLSSRPTAASPRAN